MARPGRTGGFLLVLAMAGARAAAQVPAESETWVVSGTLRQTFTDNLFMAGSDSPTEAISGATLSLSYSRVRRRTSFSALGWLNGGLFHHFTSLDSLQGGLGLSGQAGLDRRVRVQYRASYSDGLNLESLYASRVGVPQVDLKSLALSTGLTYNVAPDTFGHLSLDASVLRYRTESAFLSSSLPGDLLAPPEVVQPTRPPEDTAAPPPPDGSAQVLGDLAAEGIRLVALDYWSWHVGAGIGHTLSAETTVNLDLDYRRSYVDTAGVPDGQLFGATAGLTRTLDSTANVSLGYTFQDANYGIDTRTHSLVGRATKSLGKTLRGDLSLGASYFEGYSAETSALDFIGGAGIALQLKRTAIALRYGHGRYQGVILGRSQVTNDLFGSLGHTFGKSVSGAVFGFYRNASDPVQDLYSYDQALAGTSISVRIGRRWNLAGSYSYAHFNAGAALAGANRSVLSVSLGYVRVMK